MGFHPQEREGAMAIQITQKEKKQIATTGRRLFTAKEYQRMAEVGILKHDERVELIDGDIFKMSPISIRHVACVDRLTMFLAVKAQGTAIVRVQSSVVLGLRSQPEPDLTLLKFRPDYYSKDGATAEDVLLIIEVSDTTLSYDREKKLPLYARTGIPAVWIVNLNANLIEVYSEPADGVYGSTAQFGRGQSIQVPGLEGAVVKVEDVLG